jgi:fatty-acid peroxygenase
MSLQSFVAHQVHLPDDTLALALEGYAFIGNRCRALNTDVFETRLMLQRTICMRGVEAARMFYDRERIQREGAAPLRVQATLFGKGGVQSLDGEAHLARKRLFVSLLERGSITRLASMFEQQLLAAAPRWTKRTVLFDELQDILAHVACEWVGVRIDDDRRVRDITAMIEGSGGAGPRHWRARVGRARAEWWAEREIDQIRTGKMPPLGVLGQIAQTDLDRHTAAVELLNIIRPTVAVSRYIVFAALALHEFPHVADLLRGETMLEPFVHEVRRFYPFFPAVVGRVRKPFEWQGVEFAEHARVMLDLYGTNHDERSWPEPSEFRPERFVGWNGDRFSLIPQGGGDTETGHRCPGEQLTIDLMKTAVRVLTRRITYDVPAQDLGVSLARIPALPASRFVIENVQLSA